MLYKSSLALARSSWCQAAYMRSRHRTPFQLLVDVFAPNPTSNSFRINISKEPRKCSFQRTYGNANSFRIRIYAKWGVGCNALLLSAKGRRASILSLFASHESRITSHRRWSHCARSPAVPQWARRGQSILGTMGQVLGNIFASFGV